MTNKILKQSATSATTGSFIDSIVKRLRAKVRDFIEKFTYKERYEVARYILIETMKIATQESEKEVENFVAELIQTELTKRRNSNA